MKRFIGVLAVCIFSIAPAWGQKAAFSANTLGQKVALSTNMVGYIDLLTLNMEVSYAASRHWSVNAGVKYNPFSFGSGDDTKLSKQQCYSLGARFWPWHVYSGWWIAGKLQYQEYSRGGVFSSKTEEGDAFGAGITAGYTYMINTHLNLEFGLGFWSGVKKYTSYDCPVCGLTVSSGTKAFVLPNDIIIGITYVF